MFQKRYRLLPALGTRAREYFERAMGRVPCEVSKCRSSKALGESYLQ